MGFAINTQNCTIHTHPKMKRCFVLRLHWGIVWLKASRNYGSFALSPSHHNSNSEHSVQLSCLCQDFYGSLSSFSTSTTHNHSVFLSSKNNNRKWESNATKSCQGPDKGELELKSRISLVYKTVVKNVQVFP